MKKQSKTEVQKALKLKELPDDELMQLFTEAGDEQIVTGVPKMAGKGYTPARIHQELTEALVARSVGHLLAEARAQTGRSLRDVGAAVGVSFGRIQQLESSENVEVATLVRVAAALGFGVKITFQPEKQAKRRPQMKSITADLSDLAHIQEA